MKLIQQEVPNVFIDVERQLHLSHEIDSEAETETLETYEDRIHYYKNKRYTYIPMPSDDSYYNTEEGWTRELDTEQIIDDDTHLMDVLRKLENHPFLLVDYLRNRRMHVPKSKVLESEFPEEDIKIVENVGFKGIEEDVVELSFKQLEEYFPDRAEEEIEKYEGTVELDDNDEAKLYRYGIITLVDINRRPVKDMLYKVFSELSSQLSQKIEERYSDPEPILRHLRPRTVGRWKKDRLEGLDLHISEHMNLLEMMQVIQSSNKEFVQKCGFKSKKDVDKLNKINDVRNKVMHANRSLIYDRQDIQKILDSVDQAQTIVDSNE